MLHPAVRDFVYVVLHGGGFLHVSSSWRGRAAGERTKTACTRVKSRPLGRPPCTTLYR